MLDMNIVYSPQASLFWCSSHDMCVPHQHACCPSCPDHTCIGFHLKSESMPLHEAPGHTSFNCLHGHTEARAHTHTHRSTHRASKAAIWHLAAICGPSLLLLASAFLHPSALSRRWPTMHAFTQPCCLQTLANKHGLLLPQMPAFIYIHVWPAGPQQHTSNCPSPVQNAHGQSLWLTAQPTPVAESRVEAQGLAVGQGKVVCQRGLSVSS